MSFQERFGCFFLAIGLVVLLLFAIPTVQAFQHDPASVPLEWLGGTALALLILWAGWRLYSSARRKSESQKESRSGEPARRKPGETEKGK